MIDQKSIGVLGAGIVGVACAEWLRRDGYNVTLIDRKAPGEETSHGNAGVLCREGIVPINTPGFLKKATKMYWKKSTPVMIQWRYLLSFMPWLAGLAKNANPEQTKRTVHALSNILHDCVDQHLALAKGTGAEKWIKDSDYTFLYESEAAVQSDMPYLKMREEYRNDSYLVSGNDLRDYDDRLGKNITHAYVSPGNGRVEDPGQYVKDLASWFQGQGGEFWQAQVGSIAPKEDYVEVVTDQGTKQFSKIVLACGVWSGKFAKDLGHNPCIVAERGYHIHCVGAQPRPSNLYMYTPGKFVMNPMNDGVRCAGLVELADIDAPVNEKAFEFLKSKAKSIYPDLTMDNVKTWMGRRPSTIDSLPFIGQSPKNSRVYFGFGHQHIGLSSGAKTGRLLAQLIGNVKPNIDMEPFYVDRFD